MFCKSYFAVALLLLSGCHQLATQVDETQGEAVSSPAGAGNVKPAVKLPPVKLTLESYIEWMSDPENRIASAATYGDITYELIYRPAELIALQRAEGDSSFRKNYEVEKAALAGYQYYVLTAKTSSGENIISYKSSSAQEKQTRSNYYSFAMQKDIRLVDGTDTLKCIMFHHENAYGVLPYTNFLLGFPLLENTSANKNQRKVLVFSDRVMGVQSASLALREEDFDRIPQLVIN
jgi:hypothetical protein